MRTIHRFVGCGAERTVVMACGAWQDVRTPFLDQFDYTVGDSNAAAVCTDAQKQSRLCTKCFPEEYVSMLLLGHLP